MTRLIVVFVLFVAAAPRLCATPQVDMNGYSQPALAQNTAVSQPSTLPAARGLVILVHVVRGEDGQGSHIDGDYIPGDCGWLTDGAYTGLIAAGSALSRDHYIRKSKVADTEQDVRHFTRSEYYDRSGVDALRVGTFKQPDLAVSETVQIHTDRSLRARNGAVAVMSRGARFNIGGFQFGYGDTSGPGVAAQDERAPYTGTVTVFATVTDLRTGLSSTPPPVVVRIKPVNAESAFAVSQIGDVRVPIGQTNLTIGGLGYLAQNRRFSQLDTSILDAELAATGQMAAEVIKASTYRDAAAALSRREANGEADTTTSTAPPSGGGHTITVTIGGD